MKFSCGLTNKAYIDRKEQWHHWFAWHPVTVEVVAGHKVCVWLAKVERLGSYSMDRTGCISWEWYYREIKK